MSIFRADSQRPKQTSEGTRSRTDTKAVAPMAVLTRRRNERIVELPKREVRCGVAIK